MTSYAFAVEWLKAFRRGPEEAAALYADDFAFHSPVIDCHLTDKPAPIRCFALFANTDQENGFGIHNIRVSSFQGNSRSGLIRWEWTPQHAGAFLGIDVTDKPFTTLGQSFETYDETGKITYESAWSDATAFLTGIGYEMVRKHTLGATTASV
ncbi:hypothetical protein [Mycolicibacterium septicum]|uniref:hypothetical protein n=1 Tax=Mycolicibacterium septicum TaxID=98668 RepID=UPI00235F5975|nr:hypothetical protein [Mycolicibacterium septicum]